MISYKLTSCFLFLIESKKTSEEARLESSRKWTNNSRGPAVDYWKKKVVNMDLKDRLNGFLGEDWLTFATEEETDIAPSRTNYIL